VAVGGSGWRRLEVAVSGGGWRLLTSIAAAVPTMPDRKRSCQQEQTSLRPAGQPTCIVRMSKRPRKSLTDTIRSNMVLNRSALVPAMSHQVAVGWA
jgi:hypothetical protein